MEEQISSFVLYRSQYLLGEAELEQDLNYEFKVVLVVQRKV